MTDEDISVLVAARLQGRLHALNSPGYAKWVVDCGHGYISLAGSDQEAVELLKRYARER